MPQSYIRFEEKLLDDAPMNEELCRIAPSGCDTPAGLWAREYPHSIQTSVIVQAMEKLCMTVTSTFWTLTLPE